MIIGKQIIDELTARAKASELLRMNLDLRNSPEDLSQRMLNAIEPGTVMPIHRHMKSSETVVCVRGHFEEYFYDENGNKVEAEVVDDAKTDSADSKADDKEEKPAKKTAAKKTTAKKDDADKEEKPKKTTRKKKTEE